MKAIILTGGENARLYPLTKFCPKPLLPFLNKTLLVSQLEALARNGFTEIGVATSSGDAEQVLASLGDGAALGVKITFEVDSLPKGPAGCLKLFEKFIG